MTVSGANLVCQCQPQQHLPSKLRVAPRIVHALLKQAHRCTILAAPAQPHGTLAGQSPDASV